VQYAKTTKIRPSHCTAYISFQFGASPRSLAHEEVTDEIWAVITPPAPRLNSGNEWEYLLPVYEDDRLDFNGVGLIDAKIVKSRFRRSDDGYHEHLPISQPERSSVALARDLCTIPPVTKNQRAR